VSGLKYIITDPKRIAPPIPYIQSSSQSSRCRFTPGCLICSHARPKPQKYQHDAPKSSRKIQRNFKRLHAFLVRVRGRTDGFTEHQAGGLVVVWFVRCVHASLDAECGLYSATAQAGPLQGRSRGHAGFVSLNERALRERSFGGRLEDKARAFGT
jgi:hypothetical protein